MAERAKSVTVHRLPVSVCLGVACARQQRACVTRAAVLALGRSAHATAMTYTPQEAVPQGRVCACSERAGNAHHHHHHHHHHQHHHHRLGHSATRPPIPPPSPRCCIALFTASCNRAQMLLHLACCSTICQSFSCQHGHQLRAKEWLVEVMMKIKIAEVWAWAMRSGQLWLRLRGAG